MNFMQMPMRPPPPTPMTALIPLTAGHLKKRNLSEDELTALETRVDGMTKQVRNQADISTFLCSRAVDRILSFMLRLSVSMRGKPISAKSSTPHVSIARLLACLDQMEDIIQQAPAEPEVTQRYGNKAFRQWMEFLETSMPDMIKSLELDLSKQVELELHGYLISSFGNSTRLDYGSGHELNFMAFLTCLDLIGYFDDTQLTDVGLHVFARYIDLVRQLQTVYKLEPAGSHGVWGLDDYQFIVYYLGASQLTGHRLIKPKSITNTDMVEAYAKDYLYLACIQFINKTKSGPFHEHSPLLYDISGVLKWDKVEMGLMKMFQVEVLTKLPVVQHFDFGVLLPMTVADKNTH